MPAWPSTLPCYPIDGSFAETPQRNVVKFSPETGPPIYRRRSTANGSLASLQWKFSKAELALFRTFYETDLVDGTLPFTMEHPTTDVVYSWAFDTEPEIASAARNVHTVSAQLRRLP